MKYTTAIIIKLPVSRVVELFENPDHLPRWQPELIAFENISGTPGQPGTKSKLKYKMGKREVEMIETITTRNLPEEFAGTYEAKGVWNLQINHFKPISESQTKWTSVSEFRFEGWMKLIAVFMPGAFKKQTLKYMQRFKTFAENE